MIKAIKILIEIIGWLAIAGGVTLGAGLVSLIIYSKSENKAIAFAVLIVGFLTGAIWATRISMKHGTVEWLSQIRRIS